MEFSLEEFTKDELETIYRLLWQKENIYDSTLDIKGKRYVYNRAIEKLKEFGIEET